MAAPWHTGRTSSVATLERVNRQLLEVAERLVTEYDDVATGSVLRCLSRAVTVARGKASDPDRVPALAERLAREMLTRRHEPWVPEQRRWP